MLGSDTIGAVADGSTIEWTEATWNPTTGCDQISAGCDNCYAMTLAKRLKAMGQPRYQVDGDPRTSGPGFGVQTHPDALTAPLRWRQPRRIFVNSMSDLFHARIPVDYVREVFAIMERTPQHSYQLLTKRSSRMRKLAPKLVWPSNLWVGVTVESDSHLDRINDLVEVPAAVRFISAEPLLGSLSGIDLSRIDWLIAGGESGRAHRPMNAEWVRELREATRLSGTSFFFKQWGGVRPKSGGRTLDGRTWDEMPASQLG